MREASLGAPEQVAYLEKHPLSPCGGGVEGKDAALATGRPCSYGQSFPGSRWWQDLGLSGLATADKCPSALLGSGNRAEPRGLRKWIGGTLASCACVGPCFSLLPERPLDDLSHSLGMGGQEKNKVGLVVVL